MFFVVSLVGDASLLINFVEVALKLHYDSFGTGVIAAQFLCMYIKSIR